MNSILERRNLLVTILILFLASCSKNPNIGPQDSQNVEANFTSLYTNVFKPTCSECHVPGGSAFSDGVPLDLSSQTRAYDTLVNSFVQRPSNPSSQCDSVYVVAPEAPEASYLVGLLVPEYTHNGFNGCTPGQEHIEQNYLSSSTQNALVNWIANGAHP